jgi:hypothetical protein
MFIFGTCKACNLVCELLVICICASQLMSGSGNDGGIMRYHPVCCGSLRFEELSVLETRVSDGGGHIVAISGGKGRLISLRSCWYALVGSSKGHRAYGGLRRYISQDY